MALTKIYDIRDHTWHNNNTPALNETNLNALSQAVSDIDDRVIELGADVLETVPEILEKYTEIEALSENPPYIGANGNWFVWDTNTGAYVDSGVDASITVSVGTTSTLPAGSSATVTNSGTGTDPVLNFGIPKGDTGAAGVDGADGADGTDGVSPEVTITTITGGHTVTITDADHPSGQSFNVMDGSGNGDMQASVYDSDSAVANAGGIKTFVSGKADKVTSATNGNFAGLDSNGNLADSGKKASDFLPTANPTATGTLTANNLAAGSNITGNTLTLSSGASVSGTLTAGYVSAPTRFCVKRLKKSITLSTTADKTVTFTDSTYINSNSLVTVYTDIFGVNPSNISVSSNTVTITFPKYSSAATLTVVLEVNGFLGDVPSAT